MNLIDHNQKLPAGLVDGGIEFFIHENEIKALYKSRVFTFENFPAEVVEMVEDDMLKNPKAMKALAAWDISDEKSQMRQYISCRFGGFDAKPDFDGIGAASPAEYVACGRHGKCPHEGILCNALQVANGFLTKREIDVLKYIGMGALDKEIADSLQISVDTVRNHKDSISLKSGLERKSSLAVLAHKLNLI